MIVSGIYRILPVFHTQLLKIVWPLLNLTKKNLLWHWNRPQHNTFKELKMRMCCSPVLTQPNFKEKFYLQIDASAYSMGIILL
jgi:hypothetical protein